MDGETYTPLFFKALFTTVLAMSVSNFEVFHSLWTCLILQGYLQYLYF